MALVCCCNNRHVTPPYLADTIHYPLQPTDPPSIPYSILEPRWAEKIQPAEQVEATILRRHSLATQEGLAELDELIIEDSENEDNQQQCGNRLASAFDAVRTKLRRRTSAEDNHKRQSHALIGNSREEIARRAELKRLMHKRIQSELEDELQDEKSHEGSSIKSTQSNGNPPALVNLAKVSSGPRDCIEFVFNKPTAPEPQTLSKITHRHPNVLEEQASELEQRRCSCPEAALDHGCQRKSIEKVAHGDRLSLPDTPSSQPLSSPLFDTVHPSISQKSFQLSNSASRLDRILGPENGFSSRRASSSWDGQSALGVWLIAQGLRSRDSSMVQFETEEGMTSTSPSEGGDSVEGGEQVTPKCSMNLDYSARIKASKAQKCGVFDSPRGPDSNPTPEHLGGESLTEPAYNGSQENRKIPRPASDETLRGYAAAVVFQPPFDNTSSNYPSVLPSFQPSPARSQTNLNSLNIQDIQTLQFSPFEWYGSLPVSPKEGSSVNGGSGSIAEDHQPAGPSPACKEELSRCSIQVTHNAASTTQFETASFVQREAELQTIEKRFGQILSRKMPTKKITSRFREEFDAPSLGQNGRASFISKIYLTVPTRFKRGSRLQDRSTNDPSASDTGNSNAAAKKGLRREDGSRTEHEANSSSQSPKHVPSPGLYPKPKLEESTTDLWQRAIRLEAEERRESSHSLSASKSKNRKSSSSNTSFKPKARPRGDRSGRHEPENAQISDQRPPEVQLKNDKVLLESPETHSKWLIQRWVAQMQPEMSAAGHGVRRPDGVLSTRKSTLTPKSWAKFPSHTREGRVKSATMKDSVKPKDFAIKHISPNGEVVWTTDKDPEELSPTRSISRSLSMKVGKALKTKLSRLRLHRHIIGDQGNNPLHGRRGSAQTGGYLEYPELEILPTESGYHELRALEHEIDKMKGGGRQNEMGEQATRRRSVMSLGSRISALMFEAVEHHHNHEESSHSADMQPIPTTPVDRPHSCPGESTATMDVFVTPKSHISEGGTKSQLGDDKSPKNDYHVILRESKSEMDIISSRPRSSTWTGHSLRELPSIGELDDFRREIEYSWQAKGKHSSSISD